MNRRSPRHKGVYQRCAEDCPTDRCRTHKWAYAVELPSGGSNSRRQQIGKGGFATAREAADARSAVLEQHRAGTLPVDRTLTVGTWLARWLQAKTAAAAIDRSTEVSYRTHLDKYLIPRLGHLKLAELRPVHIVDMFIAIRAERDTERAAVGARNAAAKVKVGMPRRIGPTTCQRIHATLRSALSAAMDADEVARNAAKQASKQIPRGSRPKVKVWEPAVLGEFLDGLEESGERFYPLVYVAAFAGLRRGELVGLKWSAVDLDAGTITVDWQHSTAGYQVIEGAPKTDGSEAVVDIDAGTIRALKRWRAVQAADRLKWGPAYVDTGLVFTREDGAAHHPDYVTKRFQRLVARHGLPRTRLHDLRHLAASLQLAAGVDIAVVSKRLRHSSVHITSDTYGHLIGGIGRDAAERAAAIVPRRAVGAGA